MSLEEKIKTCAEHAIAEKVFPGCVIGITKKVGRTIVPVGSLIYQTDHEDPTMIYHSEKSGLVSEGTVYDLASVTKSVVTGTLALLLEKHGRFSRTDLVRTYQPELQNDFDATIEDLLLYRVKGVRLSTLADKKPEEIIATILETGFDAPPGERAYTNLPAFLLGLILEKIGGDSLDRLAQKHIFDPLGMKNTSFFPQASKCAPTEIQEGKEIRGIVHDESARVFARQGRAVGHAGLFSTAEDLLTYLEALLDPNDPRFQFVRVGAEEGLGFEVNREWMGSKQNKSASWRIGKTGFTGTSIVCDVERRVGLIILSNRTYPHRPQNGEAINRFRAEVANLLF